MDSPHKWLEKYDILDPAHQDGLEVAAAVHEFSGKKSRDEAEKAAHDDYRKEHLEHAAAHHLRGNKSAMASGDLKAAEKHGTMYNVVMKALGHSPYEAPPPSIVAKAKHSDKPMVHFKAHKGDLFAIGKAEDKDDK